MDSLQSEPIQLAREQRRTGFACLLLGGVTLLSALYHAAPFFIGPVWHPSRDAFFTTAILCFLTLLVGHGSRHRLSGPALPASRACIAGLACAYVTLAAMLIFGLLNGALFAAFEYMRRYD